MNIQPKKELEMPAIVKVVGLGLGIRWLAIALFVAVAGAASPAVAALTASITTNFPANVSVGGLPDPIPVRVTIANTATGGGPDCQSNDGDACQQELVTNIQIVLSCATLNGAGNACATVDPGVFTIVANSMVAGPVGPPNNACGNLTFAPTGTDVVSVNPSGDIVIGGQYSGSFATECSFDFLVHVNHAPAASPQTRQVITAHLEGDEDGNMANAHGVGSTLFPSRPMFVIGDFEPHQKGQMVNFWGAQWWKNNVMSGFTNAGYPAFKGYADFSDVVCGGKWTTLPGNSSDPPDTIPDDILVIVTSTVHKDGPNISGDIKEIIHVHSDGGYGPNPGHRGNGPVGDPVCP